MKTLYLMSPYGHESAAVRLQREVAAEEAAVRLMNRFAVFSPIVHHTRMAREIERLGWHAPAHSDWMQQDIPWLRRSDCAFLLPLEGWRESKGVREELEICKACHIPVIIPVGPIFLNHKLDMTGLEDIATDMANLLW